MNAEDASDLLHRHLIRIVENHHFVIPFRQRLHGLPEDAAKFLVRTYRIRMRFGFCREIRSREVFVLIRPRRGGNGSAVAQVDHHGAKAVDIDTHLLRHLSFRGSLAATSRTNRGSPPRPASGGGAYRATPSRAAVDCPVSRP